MRLVRNRNVVFALALGCGLAAAGGARWTRPAALPALALVMTLSSLGIRGRVVRSARELGAPLVVGLGLTYLLLGGWFAGASALFAHDPEVRDGLVLLAAVPPGVAVVPFTDMLGGDRGFSLLATVGTYLAALVVLPAVGAAAWGEALVGPGRLLWVVGVLVLLPVAASRVLIGLGWAERLEPVRGALTNWSFFVVIYTVVGLNRPFLLGHPDAVVPLLAVAAGSTFGLGAGLLALGRRRGWGTPRTVSVVLLGTLKNYGLAAGLALALFPQRTALPAVVAGTVMIPYVIWLGRAIRRGGRPGTGL
ncbi:MAG: hypothetical protein Kow0092_12480 [Deferrisomatales bacterium]